MKTVKTHWVRIYIAGPIEIAKQYLRAECLRDGLCVTIEPTTFIYTGGEEAGYVVGLVNYPKFPATEHEITLRARLIMGGLLEATHQHSAMMVTPKTTEWISKR